MTKKMAKIEQCVEVAPPRVVLPVKPSHSPKLETIREEGAEEGGDDCVVLDLIFMSWLYQILYHFRVGLSEKVVVGQGVGVLLGLASMCAISNAV